MIVCSHPSPSLRIQRTRWAVALAALIMLLAAPAFQASAQSAQSEKVATTGERAVPPTSPEFSAENRPSKPPLRLQTRYTVRRQIESISPADWLARYGRVQIRQRNP